MIIALKKPYSSRFYFFRSPRYFDPSIKLRAGHFINQLKGVYHWAWRSVSTEGPFGFVRSITCPDLSTSSRVNAFANWFVERTCPEAREGSKGWGTSNKKIYLIRSWWVPSARSAPGVSNHIPIKNGLNFTSNKDLWFDTPVLLTQNGTHHERGNNNLSTLKTSLSWFLIW